MLQFIIRTESGCTSKCNNLRYFHRALFCNAFDVNDIKMNECKLQMMDFCSLRLNCFLGFVKWNFFNARQGIHIIKFFCAIFLIFFYVHIRKFQESCVLWKLFESPTIWKHSWIVFIVFFSSHRWTMFSIYIKSQSVHLFDFLISLIKTCDTRLRTWKVLLHNLWKLTNKASKFKLTHALKTTFPVRPLWLKQCHKRLKSLRGFSPNFKPEIF